MHPLPRILPVFLLAILSLWGLTACTAVSQPTPPALPLPTLLPTAASHTDPLTNTTTLTQTATLTATVPLSTTSTATPVPTAVPSPTPVTPALNLSAPTPNENLATGTVGVASGSVTAEADWRLELALLALDGRLLTAVPVPITQTGPTNWQTDIALPSQVTGQATLQANLFGADGVLLAQTSTPVFLLPDPNDQRVLLLQRPVADQTALPGYYLYFDGQSKAPAENLIRLALLDEACQTVLREDSFRVSGSGYWQGFLPIPGSAPPGRACARAAFGPPNSDNRRETLLPITLLAPDTAEANRLILLATLPENGAVRGGDELALYGLAYNAPDDLVYITLTLADGTVLLADAIETNEYGYWELPLRIPVGVEGQAQLVLFTATAVQTLAEEAFILNIQPD